MQERILIIGAAGQIGSELTLSLRKKYSPSQVFATDVKSLPSDITDGGPSQLLDVMDDKHLIHFVIRNRITQIYHLAAVLSGNAEKLPVQAWHINMESLMNVLEIARMVDDVRKVFWPSSIAVFGPTTPRKNTPQLTVMEPVTAYGISKLAGERWCDYYQRKFGVDVRSIRYPGLLSYKTEPGGGTTDWAVEMFFSARREGRYTSFVSQDTALPMMFMPDAIDATLALMDTGGDRIEKSPSFNLSAFSFNPARLAEAITEQVPGFRVDYKPDFRQAIADSWPENVDDSTFRSATGWKPRYSFEAMVKGMLDNII